MSSTTASNAILTNSVNAIVPDTGDISIGASQTDGILNLGTGTGRTATGVINIGNGTGSSAIINIQTQNTNNNPLTDSAAINIGTSGSVKTIKLGARGVNGTVAIGDLSITTFPFVPNGVYISTTTNTTRDISIGHTQTSGILNLGTSILQTPGTRTGAVNIATQASNSCAINILNGGATVSGSVNIANVGANTTAINIGSTTGTGQINIQTANTTNSPTTDGAINIGTSAVSKTIRINSATAQGTTTAGDFLFITNNNQNTNFINTVTNTTRNIAIGSNQSTGVLHLGSGGTTPSSRSGNINIANQASNSCAINIMNGATTAGAVNIANGTGATQTTAVNIGSGSTTGVVTIGNTDNTVQVNGDLTMGTGKNITLAPSESYVAPSAGQLGSSATIIIGSNSTTANTDTTLRIATLTAGVWLLIGNCGMGGSGAQAFLSISATSALDNNSIVSTTITGLFLHISRLVTLTESATYSLIAKTTNASTLNNVNFTPVRIA